MSALLNMTRYFSLAPGATAHTTCALPQGLILPDLPCSLLLPLERSRHAATLGPVPWLLLPCGMFFPRYS